MKKEEFETTEERWSCPECGSWMITPFEYYDGITMDKLIRAEDGDEFIDAHVCWECEWKQEVRVTVEFI